MKLMSLLKNLNHFLSTHFFYPLAISTSLVFVFFIIRIGISGRIMFLSLIWNLFLAGLPYIFALTLSALYSWRRGPRLLLFIPGALWLLFLPNSFYVLTDLTHISQRHSLPIWYDAGFFSIAAWSGAFFAVASLHLVQGVVRERAGSILSWVFAFVIIGLSGYGVYLGRFLRWNSWDIWTNPGEILIDSIQPILHPFAYVDEIAFFILFTAIFLVFYLTFAWLRPFQSVPRSRH